MSQIEIRAKGAAVPEGTRIEQPWPVVLPPEWREVDRVLDGAYYRSADGLGVICSVAREADRKLWLHVSVSRRIGLPSWPDLRRVKDLFVGTGRKAIQVLPPEAEYVNCHPNVLHLWCCLDGDVLPDFRGPGGLI